MMQKFSLSSFSGLTFSLFRSLFFSLFLGLALSNTANAEGSAVFASVTTQSQEAKLKAKIADDFGLDVRTSSVWVEEVNWTRLQSSVMPEEDARALVARAITKGYNAWYNSAGNQWAASRDKSLRASSASSASTAYRQNDAALSSATVRDTSNANSGWQNDPEPNISSDNLGIVKPASGDISHLPLAETFPIE